MPLSNTYSFSVVRDDVIREAMLNVGAIGEAEVPTAQEVTDCARKLNMMVKQWMNQQDFAPGLKIWTRQSADLFLSQTVFAYQLGPTTGTSANANNWAGGVTTIPGANFGTQNLNALAAANATTLSFGVGKVGNFTVADFVVIQLDAGDIYSTTVSTINSGAGTITIPAPGLPSKASSGAYVWNYTTKAQRPLDIVTALLRDTNFSDTPMTIIRDVREYEALPTKTNPQFLSDPTAVFYESQFESGTSISGPGVLKIDCGGAQDVSKQLHIVYMRPVMDFNNPGDFPEYPQQWYRALCWGLTREICPMFDGEWTTDMKENLNESLAMARQADAETSSLYFQPNADS